MNKRILFVIPFIVLLYPMAFSATMYLQITNPNPYDLNDYQLRINITKYINITNYPLISYLNGTIIPFCYEQPNGECNQTKPTNWNGIVWIKVSIPAKNYIVIKITDSNTNYAVHGSQVFDFYDDYLVNTLSNYVIGAGTWQIQNGTLIGQYTDIFDIIVSTAVFTGTDYIVEARINSDRIPGSTTSIENGGVIFRASDINNLWLWKCGAYGKARLWKKVQGTYNSVYSTTYTWIYDWHIQKVVVHGTTTYYYINNNLVAQYSGIDIPQGSIGLESWNSILYADWLRVRKYADLDPIIIPTYSYYNYNINPYTTNTTTYKQTYLYVRNITLIPTNKYLSITDIAIPIVIDTQTLISQGKLKPDCSDIYITYYDPLYGEQPVPFWIDPTTCNTHNTIIWVKVPGLSIAKDILLYLYYGSPNAISVSDPYNTFMYFVDFSNPQDIQNKLYLLFPPDTSYTITVNGMTITTGSTEAGIFNK